MSVPVSQQANAPLAPAAAAVSPAAVVKKFTPADGSDATKTVLPLHPIATSQAFPGGISLTISNGVINVKAASVPGENQAAAAAAAAAALGIRPAATNALPATVTMVKGQIGNIGNLISPVGASQVAALSSSVPLPLKIPGAQTLQFRAPASIVSTNTLGVKPGQAVAVSMTANRHAVSAQHGARPIQIQPDMSGVNHATHTIVPAMMQSVSSASQPTVNANIIQAITASSQKPTPDTAVAKDSKAQELTKVTTANVLPITVTSVPIQMTSKHLVSSSNSLPIQKLSNVNTATVHMVPSCTMATGQKTPSTPLPHMHMIPTTNTTSIHMVPVSSATQFSFGTPSAPSIRMIGPTVNAPIQMVTTLSSACPMQRVAAVSTTAASTTAHNKKISPLASLQAVNSAPFQMVHTGSPAVPVQLVTTVSSAPIVSVSAPVQPQPDTTSDAPRTLNTTTNSDQTKDLTADAETKIEPSSTIADNDPVNILTWENGIGTLPGSNLKFQMNEFGMVEMIKDNDLECGETMDACSDPGSADSVHTDTNSKPDSSTMNPDNQDLTKCLKKDGNENCQCSSCNQKLLKHSLSEKEDAIQKKKKRKLMLIQKNNCGIKTVLIKQEKMDDDIKQEKMDDDDDVKKSSSNIPVKRLKPFIWPEYLNQEKAVGAPTKFFKEFEKFQSFPAMKNNFKTGMKLEGIDPKHQSLFCVMSVAEVHGFRMRLHFDGFSECYDFWINADSPFIFPVGWCEKNNKILQTPKGFTSLSFTWSEYLNMTKAQAAPKHLFVNSHAQPVEPNPFRVGMKLEAVDKKNTSLICVATVADVVGDYLRIRFDGWEHTYDYWCDPTSPYIHPVGWCKENSETLSPPYQWKDQANFSWDRYLSEKNASAAPAQLFRPRPPVGFECGMKVEVVDKRNPILIRVATIDTIDKHRVKIHFDGWSDVYDYWLDDDSPDIHPPGWCHRTGHSLQAPLGPGDLAPLQGPGGCPTPGCKGIGHVKGAKYSGHHSASGCSYSNLNMNKETTLHDRLGSTRVEEGTSTPAGQKTARAIEPKVVTSEMLQKCPTPSRDGQGHVSGKYNAHPGCPLAEKNLQKIAQAKVNEEVVENEEEEEPNSTEDPPATAKPVSLPVTSQGKKQKCPTPGCDGQGHVSGKYNAHPGCPLAEKNLQKMAQAKVNEEVVENEEEEEPNSTEDPPATAKPVSLAVTNQGKKQKCPTPGHDGQGHVSGKYNAHPGCPLAEKNLQKMAQAKVNEEVVENEEVEEPNSTEDPPATAKPVSLAVTNQGKKYKYLFPAKIQQEKEKDDKTSEESLNNCHNNNGATPSHLHHGVHKSVFISSMAPNPSRDLPLCWEQHSKLLPGVDKISGDDVTQWKVEDVANFIKTLPGCVDLSKVFRDEHIDGEAFLMLNQSDIVKILKCKLGPALKIFNSILMFKNTAEMD